MTPAEVRRKHPLATLDGIASIYGILLNMGAMCPKCGHGTRATSRRWARCKTCGERVERGKLEEKNHGN